MPFALLLPAYVATKSYWKDFIAMSPATNSTSTHSAISKSSLLDKDRNMKTNLKKRKLSPTPELSPTLITSSLSTSSSSSSFGYLLPPDYYSYSHPEGTGKDMPPFYSMWFIRIHDDNKDDCSFGYRFVLSMCSP